MTLQEAIDRCKSEHYVFPDIIDASAGLYEIPELNVVGIPRWNRHNPKRKRNAVLEITTFRGISSNASHFYGRIVVDGVYQATLSDINVPRNLTNTQENEHPLLTCQYVFNIKRPITKKEIVDNSDRWYAYSEGDLTECYDSSDALINDVKEIFKLRFTGEWNFSVQYPRGQKVELTFN